MADKKGEEKFEMEYRLIPNTGLKVSVLGLGTMSFDSVKQSIELMGAVRKYGVNFFDNAELYGEPCGSAEKYFGAALKALQTDDPKLWRRSDLVITTKLFCGGADGEQPNSLTRYYGPNDMGLSRKHLMEGMKESLERMQLEYVDIIYAHRFDYITPIEEVVRGFTDIIRSGKAYYWGTSQWPAQKITEAYWIAKMHGLIPPVIEQPIHNMFTRIMVEKEYLPMFEAPYRIGTSTWSPLEWGILTGKYAVKKEVDPDSRLAGSNRLGKWAPDGYLNEEKNDKVLKMMDVAKEMEVSMAQLAIGWVIKNKNVTVCMLGGRKAYQLEENMGAIKAAKRLNKERLAKLEEILNNKPPPNNRTFGGQLRFATYITDPQ